MSSLNNIKSWILPDVNQDNKIKLYIISISLVVISLFLPINFNSIAIALLAISWLINKPFDGILRKVIANKTALFLILLYLLHGLGLLYSANMDYGSKEMEYKLSMLLIPLIIATGPSLRSKHIKYILKMFYTVVLVAITIASIKAITSYMTSEEDVHIFKYFTYRDFSMPIGLEPIYFALFIVFGIFAIVFNNILDKDLNIQSSINPITWIILVVFFITLIFLSSRMEILVFIFSSICLSMYYAIRKKTWKYPILIALLVPILALSIISINTVNKERFNEMVDLEQDYTQNKWGGRSIRIEKWKNAIECWSASPIIGVGTGDTIDELVKIYSKNDFEIAVQYRFNPHNQYLQTSVALGIIGLSMIILFLLLSFVKGYSAQDWLLMIFLIIISTSMLTESMLERQKGLIFILIFSMILSQKYWKSKTDTETIE